MLAKLDLMEWLGAHLSWPLASCLFQSSSQGSPWLIAPHGDRALVASQAGGGSIFPKRLYTHSDRRHSIHFLFYLNHVIYLF